MSTDPKITEEAIAVRTGQKKLADVPEAQRAAVQKLLKSGGDAQMRQHQMSGNGTRPFGRPVPLRKARAF